MPEIFQALWLTSAFASKIEFLWPNFKDEPVRPCCHCGWGSRGAVRTLSLFWCPSTSNLSNMFWRDVSSKIFLLFISQHLRKLVTFDLFLFELHMTLLSLRLLFSIHRQYTDHSLGELKTANYIQDCEYYVRTAARKQKYKGE